MKMTDDDLLSITQQLLNEAQTYMEESITKDRAKAMRYYKGETPDNLPRVVGRSQMVVTEVRDTIEWIMPDLCKIFTGGEQVASIEPHGSEDSFDADIADEWVNYVIMRQNQGFLNTYTWIKDALLSKTGFLKQYWKVEKIRVRNDFENVTEEELDYLKRAEDFEIADTLKKTIHMMDTPQGPQVMEGEPQDGMPVALGEDGEPLTDVLYDVTGYKVTEEARIVEEVIPPEEVLFLADTKSIPHNCRFVAHERQITLGDLRELFPDADIEDDIHGPSLTESGIYDEETLERSKDSSKTIGLDDSDTHADPSQRKVWLYEIYVKCDFDGDGEQEFVQLFRVGSTIIERDEVDYPPIYSICPILWPHRFVGFSLADLLIDLQELQTALNRQILDYVYLANNPRQEVNVNGMTEDTIDDLLDNRIGGFVRVSHPGTVNPLVTSPLQPWTFNLLEHWEQRREQRTGVTRYSGGLDPNTLNKTATGVMTIMSAAARRIELIARIFAETGFKDRIRGILDLSAKYPEYVGERILRLTNRELDISADKLTGRYDLVVNAGIGAGNKETQSAHLMNLLNEQKQIIAAGFGPGNPQSIVTLENFYNTMKTIIENVGFKNTADFVTDPTDAEAPRDPVNEPQPDPAQIKAQMDMQYKMQALQQKEQESLRKDQREQEANMIKLKELEIEQQRLDVEAWNVGNSAAHKAMGGK